MSVNLAMKRLMYCHLPRKALISLLVLRDDKSSMALIFSGSNSIVLANNVTQQFPGSYPKGAFLRIQSQFELHDPLKESL